MAEDDACAEVACAAHREDCASEAGGGSKGDGDDVISMMDVEEDAAAALDPEDALGSTGVTAWCVGWEEEEEEEEEEER